MGMPEAFSLSYDRLTLRVLRGAAGIHQDAHPNASVEGSNQRAPVAVVVHEPEASVDPDGFLIDVFQTGRRGNPGMMGRTNAPAAPTPDRAPVLPFPRQPRK